MSAVAGRRWQGGRWQGGRWQGGPSNVTYWRKLAGSDDDLFLELVSFAETQLYLRTIAVQANHYRRMYPELVSP